MIPPPSDKDDADVHARYEEIKSGKSKGIGGDTYYGYTENLQDVVADNLTKHGLAPQNNNIKLIKGYRSEEHTSELQSLMRISYAVFCLKKKIKHYQLDITAKIKHYK